MRGYLTFIFAALILIMVGDLTRKKGFNRLTVKRGIDNEAICEGEEIKITTIIENNKWLPIDYLVVQEAVPSELPRNDQENYSPAKENVLYYTSRYTVLWYERIKKTYIHKGIKRGTYFLMYIKISIGDVFGFSSTETSIEDYVEILVYPRIVDIKNFKFENTNTQGDNIVKRWIFKDPLYIKGIREYNVEDRMKDIHWKSSLKMSRLMVKDYDYTSDREVIFIVDVQCGEPYWATILEKNIEDAIRIGVSLAQQAIKDGISTGMWTNAQLMGGTIAESKNEVQPSLNSFKSIMELSARMFYTPRTDFHKYLEEKLQSFNTKSTYIVITNFLNCESQNFLNKLKRVGVSIKVIDVSENGTVPDINGIEKVNYKGEY